MTAFLDRSIEVAFVLVVVAVAMAFVRLFKGPSLQDRVVALDYMTIAIVAFCALAAMRYGQVAFLDVALVLALVGFLATVALARFAERNVSRRRGGDGPAEGGDIHD